jgi:transcriptional regulator with XRE-family HTH domain
MKHDTVYHPREALRAERLQRNWSQSDVAERLGVTVVTVSRWEQGINTPSPYFRLRLCALFSKDATELGLLPPEPTHLPDIAQDHPLFLCDPIIPSPQQEQCPLIGRTTALQQVIAHLCRDQVKSYAIVGLPGVGKTSLALALAQHPQVRKQFCDGILWASLGPTPQLSETLSRWATVLHLNLSDVQRVTAPDAWARYLHQQIGDRRMLFILDDGWKLADGVIMHLGGNQCAYLLTTRFPVLAHAFAGEQVLHLHELTETDSLMLLQHIAPLVHQEHFEHIQRLVQMVGGLPLALTLLGRHLQVQSLIGPPRRLMQTLQHLCTNIQTRFHLEEPLTSWTYLPNYPPGTAMSLRFAISQSVYALPTTAQEALHALAIFPPKPYTFSEEAACAVGNVSPETLDLLVDSGLVELFLQERYQIHHTIADYARLREPNPEIETRLVTFVATFVETHQQDFPVLEQELYTITRAFEIAYARRMHQSLLTGFFALVPFLEHRHLYTLAETLLEQAQQAAIHLDDQQSLERTLLLRDKMDKLRSDFHQAQHAHLEGLAPAQ